MSAKKRRPPAQVPPQPPAQTRKTPFLPLTICIFLAVAVAVVFGQTLQHGFVNLDDPEYVYENQHVFNGLDGAEIGWAFRSFHAANWHPLTWLSHMLDCEFYGASASSAGGHHASSVLLHAAAAMILFLLLRRMTGAIWPSALAAAVFAVHPLRVESVAWVAERKDVLSGLFFVLTLWAYVAYADRPFSWLRYGLVALLYALGLMAKPMLVTLPLVLVLLDYWPLGRFAPSGRGEKGEKGANVAPPGRLLLEKLPLLALAAASCVVTLSAQGVAIIEFDKLSLDQRVANAVVSLAAYLGQFFYPNPARLAVFYPYPDSLPLWEVAGALAILALVSVGVILARRKYPFLIVGWLWYLGMMVPVIGLVQVGLQAMADRYTYLPMIGVTIALVWFLASLAERRPWGRMALGIAGPLAVVVLMGCAWLQTSYWRNSETLWTHALKCNPRSPLAHVNLGRWWTDQGKPDLALKEYRAALDIDPNYILALNNSRVHALPARGNRRVDRRLPEGPGAQSEEFQGAQQPGTGPPTSGRS